MTDESGGKESTVPKWAGWAARIASALLAVATIHYIGFFSTLADDYFVVMSSTLIRRVAWELIAALALTSLYLAVFLLVAGLFRGVVLGSARAGNSKAVEGIDGYPLNPFQIAGAYISVLAVTYFPFEGPLHLRLLFFFSAILMLFLFYVVFLRKVEDDTGWSRFVGALRHRELAVRALVAFALSISYFAGKGLAWSLMSAEPVEILTAEGRAHAVIIDATDTALLIIKGDNGLELLPFHAIDKVVWPGDAPTEVEKD